MTEITTQPRKINFSKKGQSDSGANASATDNLSLLEDVTWIKPMRVGTASSTQQGGITMQAIGRLPIQSPNGEVLKIACYYSPDVEGTIISPQAIAMEYKDRFFGWIHFCNTDSKTGYIRLCNRNQAHPFSFGIWSENNLWFQTIGVSENKNPITAINQQHHNKTPDNQM